MRPALRFFASRPLSSAALAGVLAVGAFEPLDQPLLGILAPAMLLLLWQSSTGPGRAALSGFAFGAGFFGAGVSWVYVSLHTFGMMPAPLAALATLLFCAFLALFPAAVGYAQASMQVGRTATLLLAVPALWALLEWLRSWIFTGFPWATAGYAHNIGPLGGYAPVIGVYGVSVLAAVCAGALAILTQRARLVGVGVLVALLGAGYGLTFVDWTHPQGQPLAVRLLQGNVPQQEKFDTQHIRDALALYLDMIEAQPADLIATPETAIVLFPYQLPPGYLTGLRDFAVKSNSALLYGIPLTLEIEQFSNSVAGVSPSGAFYHYDKHHLVPFGEFVPYGFHWFVRMLQIPLGDFNSGADVQPAFAVKDQWVLPNICFEDLFGEEIAKQLRGAEHPATMLLNVSNLAWFGESIAVPQHLQISQMRALETGRPMLRSTNTGATAVIDAHGAVLARLAPYTRGTLALKVQGMAGSTPYIVLGNALFLLLAALTLAGAWYAGRKSGKISAKPPQK